MSEIIKLVNVKKKFGSHAIFENLNLNVEENDFVAIVGKSGKGKTTLLNMIGCIEPITSGEINVCGIKNPNINKKSGSQLLRNKISFLFQNYALVDDETVNFNLDIALRFTKSSKSEKATLKKDALKMVGLSGYESRKVYELSGGEQQRIAIARAILKPSNLVLADEPTGSLDPENRDIVLKLLSKMNEMGKTIIVVTHDSTVADYCKRKIII
ncbi:bacteriocin ABC transporter ATP-binding protein [Clostridium botulinum]|uniref:Macrolide export ATP-binding/permease protein MacB n=2 Tax=Clostridium botulinum TaxID=1491 RepID=A0A9P2LMC3_CLOBO|nr:MULTISPECIES: ABC transporter ATP-binding protein [Clostridium]EES92276.1 macrolide export ATP-binding/permease protein MacB [Clostridium botulinum D str. 1873]KGM93973.1 bacteriocin ABC transporter ATP-binding protein [Clostridium botulinum D str. CCUG 7971]KGM99640.1 bacteriocin ABC transporter ATP-binding protein [Clostridium botulinum C/D str. DC5]KOC51620.1 bacteriocin ABC transporter ATP-binding protein [Clostridium botulinum]KOC53503.1 bacteriocin ABC transporter ATP-binding protein 